MMENASDGFMRENETFDSVLDSLFLDAGSADDSQAVLKTDNEEVNETQQLMNEFDELVRKMNDLIEANGELERGLRLFV